VIVSGINDGQGGLYGVVEVLERWALESRGPVRAVQPDEARQQPTPQQKGPLDQGMP
jgi:hypothetical protein